MNADTSGTPHSLNGDPEPLAALPQLPAEQPSRASHAKNPRPNTQHLPPPTPLGRIVKSTSHTDYVAQVYRRWEVPRAPTPADHAFGTFARIRIDDRVELVGVVYDTQLLNPEFGTLGPRLASREAVEVFAPDYLDEKAILIGLFIAGQRELVDGHWRASHDVPSLAADVDAEVVGMDEAAVASFHATPDGLRVGYFPRLLAQPSAVAPSLMLRVLDRLHQLFPDDATRLAVLRRNIAWKASVSGF